MHKILQMNIQNQKENRAPQTNINILIHALLNFCRGGSHNYYNYYWLVVVFLLAQTTPPVTAQQTIPASPPSSNKNSMVGVMIVVAVLFFISGFISVYTRYCSDRQTSIRGRIDLTLPIGDSSRSSRKEPSGLNPEVIETFPILVYSSVKDLMIARDTLTCAVCLDEFKDDDMLRLIPTCSHLFHPTCIDLWFESHTTCPVCRANLVPKSEDEDQNESATVSPFVSIQLPNGNEQQQQQPQNDVVLSIVDDDDDDVESANENLPNLSHLMNHQIGLPRSWSTGSLLFALFQSNSARDSHVIEPGESCERFTLTLPDEVRRELENSTTLNRTNSCVSFRRMRSGRKGYRTRSSTV